MKRGARAAEAVVALWNRLRFVFRRRQLERELAAEMQFHEQMLIRDYIAEGMTPDAARGAARRRLGNTVYFGEASREEWGFRWFDELVQDIRFGVRGIKRHAAISAAVILTLALAMGANTAVFSAINVLLLRSAPLADVERLAYLEATRADGSFDCCFRLEEIAELRHRKTIEQLGFWDLTRLNVAVAGQALPADGWLVSGDLFEVVGAHAAAGRLISPADVSPSAPPVAVISHRLWMRGFGGDYSAIGSTISLDNSPITVIGVLPPDFTLYVGKAPPDVWVPNTLHARLALADHDEYHVVARLKPTATHATAAAELTQAWRTLTGTQGRTDARETEGTVAIRAVPAAEATLDLGTSLKPQLRTLMLAGLLVLIIVCANVANLQFARGVTREREVAMRLALGAGRFRLMRMLLTESAVLAVLGGAVGLLIARVLARPLLVFIAAQNETLLADVSPDPRILAFTGVTILVALVVFGLPPAFRTSQFDLHQTLKLDSAGARGSRSVLRIGRVLVAVQVALCLMIVVTASVFIRTVRALNAREPGFEREHLLTFGFYTVTLGYSGGREQALYLKLQDRLLDIPGVHSASLHRYSLGRISRSPCTGKFVRGQAQSDFPVGPRFFQTLGLPLIAGREFTAADRAGGAPVAIIGEAMARAHFPAGNAVGGAIRRQTPLGPVALQVIGVSRDFGYAPTDGRAATPCQLFTPVAQDDPEGLGQMTFLVRASGSPTTVAQLIPGAVREVDPNLAVRDLSTFAEVARNQYSDQTALATLTTGFGILALVFAAVGLFGMLSYAVTCRRPELLVRIALGARPGNVVAGVMAEVFVLVTCGALLGAVASVVLVRVTGSFLYGVSELDVVAIAVAILIMSAIGALAGYVPARRVSRLDPALVLRA